MQYLVDGFVWRCAGERPAARRQLVKHDAETEDIRAIVQWFAECLLGRHIRNGAGHRIAACPVRGLNAGSKILAKQSLRETEIEDLRHSAGGHHDISRFDVAMDDAKGMGSIESLRDLNGNPGALAGCHRPTAHEI